MNPLYMATDIEVQVVGLIKIIIDPESIMTESTAVSTENAQRT